MSVLYCHLSVYIAVGAIVNIVHPHYPTLTTNSRYLCEIELASCTLFLSFAACFTVDDR